MTKFLNLITVLILTTYFKFILCDIITQGASEVVSRVNPEQVRAHLRRKGSGPKNMYTEEFLKEIEAQMKGSESKVPEQWQAAVPNPKKKVARNQDDQNLPQKKKKVGRKGRKRKENSEENYDSDKDKKENRHKKIKTDSFYKQKAPEHTTINCNKKCFTIKCEVECTGDQTSAACSAPGCKSLTTGEDSASLCSGESCQALCFKEECISGCEGKICSVKCHGKRCHAVVRSHTMSTITPYEDSEGSNSQSTCLNQECMAYGNGNRTHITCTGDRCQAQCMGEDCMAECNGIGCVAGCTGKNCEAVCKGNNCQELEHVGDLSDVEKKDSPEDSVEDGNKINPKEPKQKPRIHTGREYTEDSDEKVKLEYNIDVRVTRVLAEYIRDKIGLFKAVAGYLKLL